MKNKTLLLIFLTLLVGFLASQFAFEKKKRTFKTELIQLDTSAITSILLYPKSDNQEEILLKKEKEFWVISKGNVTNKANQAAVTSILRNLSLIKTKRVASKSQDKWADYEVDAINGSRVKAYGGDKLLEDFIVGRFNFNQQTRQGISYVRLEGGDEVYAVDGFLSMTMSQGFEAYRNKEILTVNKSDLTQISINTIGITTLLQKSEAGWAQDGGPVDSTTLFNYLDGLQQITGSVFADDFEDYQSNELLYKTLLLEGNNISTPLVIKAYKDTTRSTPFIIQSSLNPNNYFQSEENGIFEQLFGGW